MLKVGRPAFITMPGSIYANDMHASSNISSSASVLHHVGSDPLLYACNATRNLHQSLGLKAATAGNFTEASESHNKMNRLTSLALVDLGSLDLLPVEGPKATRSHSLSEATGAIPSFNDHTQDDVDILFTRTADQDISSSTAAAGTSITGLTDSQLLGKQPVPGKQLDATPTSTADLEQFSSSSEAEAFAAAAVPDLQGLDDDVAAAVDQSAHQHLAASATADISKHAATKQKPRVAELHQLAQNRFKQGLGCPTGVRFFTDKGM